MTKKKRGQIIVEVLFAVGVVAMCLIGLTSAATTAINNGIFAKNNQLANRYTQEGLEITRSLRDRAANWSAFNYVGDWCLDSSLGWAACNCSVANPNVDIFFRCLTFEDDTPERKKITAKVSWVDGTGTHNVEATTFLTKWSKS